MMLPALLANADATDSTVTNLTTVLICAGIAVGVLIVAAAPILIAWSRRHRHAEGLTAVAVLWGLIAAVSFSVSIFDQMKYSREHLMAVES
jgi:Na+/melibiose symporter-like transporter